MSTDETQRGSGIQHPCRNLTCPGDAAVPSVSARTRESSLRVATKVITHVVHTRELYHRLLKSIVQTGGKLERNPFPSLPVTLKDC